MFRPHAFSHLPQLCASALLVVLATSSAGAEVPAEADKAMQREANFKAGFVNGCMKSRDRRGVDERYTRAFCVCAMLQFRAAMSEAEFQQILDRLSNSAQPAYELPQFGRGGFAGLECENLGSYDAASPDHAEMELRPRRRFDEFSIRLPRGFVSAQHSDGPGRTQNFFRLHADLESASALSFGVAPAAIFPGSQHIADAPDWYLSVMLEPLKRRWQKSNWAHRRIPDRAIGSFTFKVAEWTASDAGAEHIGLLYVTVIRDQLIIITMRDVKPHAVATLPLMESSVKTLIFHGADHDGADSRDSRME